MTEPYFFRARFANQISFGGGAAGGLLSPTLALGRFRSLVGGPSSRSSTAPILSSGTETFAPVTLCRIRRSELEESSTRPLISSPVISVTLTCLFHNHSLSP